MIALLKECAFRHNIFLSFIRFLMIKKHLNVDFTEV